MTTTDLTAASAQTPTTSASDLLATPAPHASADEFAERVLAATLGSMEITAIHLGERLPRRPRRVRHLRDRP